MAGGLHPRTGKTRSSVIRRLVADEGFQGYSREYRAALGDEDALTRALHARGELTIVRSLRPNIREIGMAYQECTRSNGQRR
jgi:hypothetical protein